jgi:hypothetical protein
VETETALGDLRIWLFLARLTGARKLGRAYSIVVCTHAMVELSFEPSPETAVMIAIDMAAAISPYTTVVAPR